MGLLYEKQVLGVAQNSDKYSVAMAVAAFLVSSGYLLNSQNIVRHCLDSMIHIEQNDQLIKLLNVLGMAQIVDLKIGSSYIVVANNNFYLCKEKH